MREIAERVERAIRENVFPGCVIGILREGQKKVFPFGHFTYEKGEQVYANSLYDLASITKSIPTASLAALFAHEKKFALSDKVKKYIPELQNDRDATIEDLLRYRVFGAALSKLPLKTFEELRTHVLERGFDALSGKSTYTNLPAFLLGMLIERVANSSLAALSEQHFFGPLQMKDTSFFPAPSLCAPTEIGERGEVRGLPHDESAYLFAVRRRTVGHAGLFSTAPDLLMFLDALLNKGLSFVKGYEGESFADLGPVLEAAKKGLGWQLEGRLFGSSRRVGLFGKTGFTGTSIVCDPVQNMAFVILANRTYPKRPESDEAINSVRADIADIVFSTI